MLNESIETKTRHYDHPGVVAACSGCGREKEGGIKLYVDAEPAALRDVMIDSLRVTVDGQAQIYEATRLPGSLGIRTSPGNKHIVEGPAAAPIARGEGAAVP